MDTSDQTTSEFMCRYKACLNQSLNYLRKNSPWRIFDVPIVLFSPYISSVLIIA